MSKSKTIVNIKSSISSNSILLIIEIETKLFVIQAFIVSFIASYICGKCEKLRFINKFISKFISCYTK